MLTLNTEHLRYIGMLTMLIDHIGFAFNIDVFRIVGRVAFPVFSIILINNIIRGGQEILEKYYSRLLTFGILSQIPFYLFTQSFQLNIMFQFLGFVMYLRGSRILGMFISVLSDYSIFGFIYMYFLYRYRMSKNNIDMTMALVSGMLLNIMFIDILHVLITIIITSIFLLIELESRGRGLPYYVFYGFYPAHMLGIYLVKMYLQI
ncbi:MAG: conjugal transfer protein TraX [Candidatus Micrarchaeota archaeon]|nr:conjugal transfer protein TraX [Candidatus Micrarchaeota archaeon]MCX8154477.1 conjugal transfer protein TraX [Candidatus Micrarchaeota archaeon]